MVSIDTKELQNNLDYYLRLSNQEDIYITHHGVIVSKLSRPNNKIPEIVKAIDDLAVPTNIKSNDNLLEEELLEKYLIKK